MRTLFGTILLVVLLLTGCTTVPPTLFVSPFESPLPEPTPSPAPAATATEAPVAVAPDLDLAQFVLIPEDMADLFAASYSVSQPYEAQGGRGLQVMYPTRAELHTSGFLEGFATQAEVYGTADAAAAAFAAMAAKQDGLPITLAAPVDALSAWVNATKLSESVSPDSGEADNYAYTVILQDEELLALITVKSPTRIADERLAQMAQTVAQRMASSGS